jgi:restriction endonuclease S subunit
MRLCGDWKGTAGTVCDVIDSYHNEAIASLTADDEMLKQYLLWTLPAVAAYAASNPAMMGTTLNSKSMASLLVPVPPRQEQHRIVEGLRSLSSLVERIAAEVGEVQDLSTDGLKLIAQHRAMSSWVESPAECVR